MERNFKQAPRPADQWALLIWSTINWRVAEWFATHDEALRALGETRGTGWRIASRDAARELTS